MTAAPRHPPSARFPWTGVALSVLAALIAVAPWPSWWSNLLLYHAEPETKWRLLLGAFALALMAAMGVAWRRPHASLAQDISGRRRRPVWFFLPAGLLLIAAAVPRLYWPADWVKLGAPDHVEYALGGHNLLERGTYAIELNGRWHPPRYPYGYSTFFVAPVLAMTGSEPRHAVYASLLSGILVVVLLATIGWRSFGAVTAAGSVCLLLLYPLFLKYTREVFADAAVTALFLGVYALVLYLRPTRLRWLLLGLFIGTAASVKFSLVLGAVVAWLGLRLSPTERESDEKPTNPETDGAIGTRRGRLMLDLYLALGIGIGLLPLLVYNVKTFGAPLRTGYHYWCSVPYDFPELTFSPAYLWQSAEGVGRGNVLYYLLPGGEMNEKAPYYAIQAAYWLLVLTGLTLGWKAPGNARRTVRLMAAGSAVQFAFFSLYFFRSMRLLLPVYVLLLPVAVYALVRLFRVPRQWQRSRPLAIVLAAALAAGFWFLGPRYQRFESIQPDYRNTLTAAAQDLLPDDALIVSDLDGAYVKHYLLEGSHREYLPLDRGVEYASKYAQPRRPPTSERPTDDPFDHRAIPAEAWNAVEVYPITARESPGEIVRRFRNGQPCYAVLEDPRAVGKLRSLADGAYLERVAPGINLYRLRPYGASSGN